MTTGLKSRAVLMVCFVAVLVSGAVAKAQTTSSTIAGVVRDEQRSVVPGAGVTVTNTETGMVRHIVTDEGGRYRIPQLAPGVYELKAEVAGFQTEVRKGLTLTVASEEVVDFTLKVGDVTQRIEVTGEAPLVQTTASSVSSLVDEHALNDLPLNGRSFIELVRLQDGVNAIRAAGTGAAYSFGQHISVAGSNPESNNFMMDGTNISTYQGLGHGGVGGGMPGVEAVKEFRVLSHNYSAEFGRGTGAMINAVTKSGTNSFHGSLYEFIRNDNLDARKFFDQQKPEFKRNQFGASAGGPIRKNKAFFFVNYEALRERLGQTFIPTVPTAAARQGILPTGNVNVSAGVRPYLNLYPLPNGRDFRDGSAEFLTTFTQPTTKDYMTARLDYTISSSHWAFIRYTYDAGDTIQPGTFPQLFNERAATPLRYGTLEFNSMFSPTVLNTFRFGVVKTPTVSDNIALANADPSLFLVPGFRMSAVSITGVSGIGPNDALLHIRDYKSFEWSDNVSITKGPHSIKTGFMIQRIINNPTIQTRMGGRFTFASLANLLQGNATTVEFAPPALSSPSREYRQNLLGFFFQDDYKLRPNLTLNLGVRYELTTVLSEIQGRFPKLLDNQIFTATRLQIVISPPGYLSNPDLKNFAPRLGVAYDPFGKGKTSIRAGFGIYHDHIFFSALAHEFARMAPHNVFIVNNLPYPTTADVIVSRVGSPAIGNTAIYFQNDPSPQYSIHTEFDIQHQLASNWVFSAGYRGSRAVHVLGYEDFNAALPISSRPDGTPVFSATPVRPNPNFEAITYKNTGNDSYYHGLSLRAEKRFSSGLQLQARYTFSKAIDNASTAKGGNLDAASSSGISSQIAWYNKRADKALSAFDLTHNFNVSFTYALPFAKGMNGWMKQTFGGWSTNGIISLSSGSPFTLTQGTNALTNLIAGQRRPDIVAGRTKDNIIKGGPDQYFDPTAFTFAPPALWGTAGRNILRAPGYSTFDFSLNKDWRMRAASENLLVQFRAELYNLFNRANFQIPAVGLFNGTGARVNSAGRITDTVDAARQIQFGLKVVF